MNDMQKFIDEVHHNESMKQQINQAGKALTEQNSKELRMKLASEMAIIADQHGYQLQPEDFYDHVDTSGALK